MRLLPLLIFVSLASDAQTRLPQKQQLSFDNLVKNIEVVHLPYSQKCGGDIKISKTDIAIYKYFPPLYPDQPEYGWHIVGKIAENDKYVALLAANTYADYAVPYLTTFTRQGKPIEKFELYRIGCGEDELFYSETRLTIGKDLSVHISDSTATYKRDNAGEIIKKSIQSKSNNYLYKLKDDGTIMKVKRSVK